MQVLKTLPGNLHWFAPTQNKVVAGISPIRAFFFLSQNLPPLTQHIGVEMTKPWNIHQHEEICEILETERYICTIRQRVREEIRGTDTRKTGQDDE